MRLDELRYRVCCTHTHQEALAEKVLLGSVPIMLRSKYCVLNERETSAGDMYGFKECPLDVGGYFVVNGTEKVCRLLQSS